MNSKIFFLVILTFAGFSCLGPTRANAKNQKLWFISSPPDQKINYSYWYEFQAHNPKKTDYYWYFPAQAYPPGQKVPPITVPGSPTGQEGSFDSGSLPDPMESRAYVTEASTKRSLPGDSSDPEHPESHGSSSTHSFGISGKRDRLLKKIYIEGILNATANPECPKPDDPKTCRGIIATTSLTIQGVTRKIVDDSSEQKFQAGIPAGNNVKVNRISPRAASPQVFASIDLEPIGSPEELLHVFSAAFSSNAEPGATPSLNVDLDIGPHHDQLRSYDVKLTYSGLECILTSSTPTCGASFLGSLIAGLTSSSYWNYNSVLDLWELTSDLYYPEVVSYKYLLGSDSGETGFNVSSSPIVDPDVESVPGPLPLLGVGAAFGYGRKLRKRIKSSKSPEVMSAIGKTLPLGTRFLAPLPWRGFW